MVFILIIGLGMVGYAIGLFVGRNFYKPISGFLIVDKSDEDTIKWTLDVRIDPEALKEHDEVLLQVIEK